MKYCSDCGGGLAYKLPDGDNFFRYVCERCNVVHYQNPKMIVGCIPVWQEKVLLCKRGIEPAYGAWTFPAGFMENFETAQDGAKREAFEEAGAVVEIGNLFSLTSIPYINQVYVVFEARMLSPNFAPGSESLEVELFGKDEIPWNNMAFSLVKTTLMRHYENLHSGARRFYAESILSPIDEHEGAFKNFQPSRLVNPDKINRYVRLGKA